ncbi:MAG: stage 0 sporulation family protein [Desulfuromonadales bacterium]|nr:stage 0 sporulation family protein [Desulfuromonadales bacterium]
MLRIVPVKFNNAGRQYDFNAQSLELKPGSRVVVETDRGRALAIAVTAPREVPEEQAPQGLKTILRLATDEDLAQAASNAAREKDAVRYCQGRVQARNMEMKLVRAEYAFDGSKIVFYFTAEGRIDFRDLVKDLAHYFHTRIEMRQIGVRDEAKLVGGMGICGRELCCCSFLTEFYPVSVKMAKEQGLALNPTKISGQCGRLLCCLGYEFESYCELRKGMPKCGKKVCWDDKEWEVTAQNALGRQITLRKGDGTTRVVTMDEYETGHPREADPAEPTPAEPRRHPQPAAQKSRPAPVRESSVPVPAVPPVLPTAPPAEAAGEAAAGDAEKTGARRKRRRRRRGNRPSTPGEQGE